MRHGLLNSSGSKATRVYSLHSLTMQIELYWREFECISQEKNGPLHVFEQLHTVKKHFDMLTNHWIIPTADAFTSFIICTPIVYL